MNSEPRSEEEKKRFLEKMKSGEESQERLDEMMKEGVGERIGLFHKLEKVAEGIRKKLSGEGPDKDGGKKETKTEKKVAETADRKPAAPVTAPPSSAPTTSSGEIPPTTENVYITRWDLLSDKSRLVALFYFDQFRWRYQYGLITPHIPKLGYLKKKKKKKKRESDYTELFMVDELFGGKDVDFSKVVGNMI